MGWFDDSDESASAVSAALSIARNKPMQASARSRTEQERASLFWKVGCIAGGIVGMLVFALILAMALADSRQSREALPVVLVIALLAIPLVYLAVRLRMNRGGKYRDPGIVVDVGTDGIVLRTAQGSQGMAWREIDASVNWMSMRHSIHFLGLRIQSPLGLIDLKEETYVDGMKTAALIVRGMHEAYWQREREKVERMA